MIACAAALGLFSAIAGTQAGAPAKETAAKAGQAKAKGNAMGEKIQKTDEEWRAQLTPEQYRITRECGTEPPFSGKYYYHREDGTYRCIGCGNALFTSGTKYESGSGWPSFWQPASPQAIEQKTDRSHGMARTEVVCGKCGAHLGHVFPDGPRPTGLRYCINSVALDFTKDTAAADSADAAADSSKGD